ncbi:putative Short-chain dehydrogenase [Seiridium unicorne]|uniref:Short-chain dehydrogenase n=1 Tax=Seiridium unicorne TaxID=138068 RepID=A0ABR2VCX9_9PEZI
MTATTHPEFNNKTEALEVAQAFADVVRGKTVLITGVNSGGIGYTTAEAFCLTLKASQSPAHLIIAGRTPSKIQESITNMEKKFPEVDYRPLEIDLSSQKSVRTAAAELLSWPDVPVVDIVVNSAGIMNLPERTFSDEGIEMTFATNHIGHFLFTNLIMPKLIKAAGANPVKGATRVINVSSGSPTVATMRWSDPKFEKKNSELPESERPNYDIHRMWGIDNPGDHSYIPLEAYNQSKVANVLYGIGLTRRLYDQHGILGLSLHPGVIPTELSRSATPHLLNAIEKMKAQGAFEMKTLGAGGSTSLVAALDPKLGKPESRANQENFGAFLSDCQISDQVHPLANSSTEAEKLWKLSEDLVGEKFSW